MMLGAVAVLAALSAATPAPIDSTGYLRESLRTARQNGRIILVGEILSVQEVGLRRYRYIAGGDFIDGRWPSREAALLVTEVLDWPDCPAAARADTLRFHWRTSGLGILASGANRVESGSAHWWFLPTDRGLFIFRCRTDGPDLESWFDGRRWRLGPAMDEWQTPSPLRDSP